MVLLTGTPLRIVSFKFTYGHKSKVICSKIATGSKHIREFPTLFVYNTLMCVLSRFKNLCLPIQAQLGLDLMLFEYLIRSVVHTHNVSMRKIQKGYLE